jgi:hypothetical protein
VAGSEAGAPLRAPAHVAAPHPRHVVRSHQHSLEGRPPSPREREGAAGSGAASGPMGTREERKGQLNLEIRGGKLGFGRYISTYTRIASAQFCGVSLTKSKL